MSKQERQSLDSESQSENSNDLLLGERTNSQRIWPKSTKALTLLLIANLVVFIATFFIWMTSMVKNCNRLESEKEVSYYSPIFDKKVEIGLNESQKNHTLWGDDENLSIYIRDPSPEVDSAWDHIAADASPIITINSDEAIRLGRDPSVIVKAPADWGFGDDAYPAQIDVFHEIHCLNMLRKEMWWDHYFRPRYGNPENADYLHVRHKRHCLRIILRTLMCHSDVDIVTHNWRRGSYRPIADFNNPRKCRNFAGLLEWNNANAVQNDMEKWRTIKRPDNAVVLPKPTPNLYTSEDSEDWINGV